MLLIFPFKSISSFPSYNEIIERQFELTYHLRISPMDSEFMTTFEVSDYLEMLKKRLEKEKEQMKA